MNNLAITIILNSATIPDEEGARIKDMISAMYNCDRSKILIIHGEGSKNGIIITNLDTLVSTSI